MTNFQGIFISQNKTFSHGDDNHGPLTCDAGKKWRYLPIKSTDNLGGGPKVFVFFYIFLISLFSVLIISLCVGLAGLAGSLGTVTTVEVCEVNNWKELNLNRSSSWIINWICGWVPDVCHVLGPPKLSMIKSQPKLLPTPKNQRCFRGVTNLLTTIISPNLWWRPSPHYRSSNFQQCKSWMSQESRVN